jgi:predicted RNase H-like HicB family nuclease
MLNAIDKNDVRPTGDVLPHSVPIVIRCLFEKTDSGWQGFTLEYGLAVQGDTLVDAKKRLESIILSYLEDALLGEDRPHAEALLRRRATLRVYFRYHAHRLRSFIHRDGGGSSESSAFPLPLKAGLCLT